MSIYNSHETIPDNFNETLHPYGPFKSYEFGHGEYDLWNDSRYVVNLFKPWSIIEENMTPAFGNLHAHISRDSRDCDGRYEHDYITVASQCNFNACREDFFHHPNRFDWNAYQPVTNEAEFRYMLLDLDEWDNQDGHYRFEPYGNIPDSFCRDRSTEEGYESEHVQFCYDWTCDLGEKRFRDHTAEAHGY